MGANVELLRKVYAQLKADRSNVENVWNQIEKFIHPLGSGTSNPVQSEGAVEWQRLELWDMTAPDSAEKLAASIHSSAVNPAMRWFKLTFREKTLENDTEAAEWLEDVGERVFNALQESDFNTEIGSGLLDFVCYANVFLIAESANELKWEGLDFTTVPIREGFIEENSKGLIRRFFRKLMWTPVQIADKFGEDKLPERIKEALKKEGCSTEKLEVAFCIFERPEEKKRKRKSKVLAPELRPYGYVYFLPETGEVLGEEGGYYEMPVFLARWQKTPGSVWGHGPANTALPTVKYLNACLELDKLAREKAVDPSLMSTERGLLSDNDSDPGGITMVRELGQVEVLESKARFDVSNDNIADLRGMIRRRFHSDELDLKDSPAMTATEAQIRYELMNRLLGSTLARLQSDMLDPLILLVVHILYRAKQLKPMPASVKAAGGDFNIEYQGPLSRAQRTDEVAAIERLASFVAALKKMEFVEAEDAFNPEEAVRAVAKRLGTPARCINSAADARKRARTRAQLMERVAQAEAARAEGEAVTQQAEAANAVASVPASPAPVVAPPLAA